MEKSQSIESVESVDQSEIIHLNLISNGSVKYLRITVVDNLLHKRGVQMEEAIELIYAELLIIFLSPIYTFYTCREITPRLTFFDAPLNPDVRKGLGTRQ